MTFPAFRPKPRLMSYRPRSGIEIFGAAKAGKSVPCAVPGAHLGSPGIFGTAGAHPLGTQLDILHDGSVIRYDDALIDPMEPRLFDVAWLKAEGHHRGSSSGRGEAHFLSFAGREMVLRYFRRGGLVGKINRDLYLRRSVGQSRSMQEFELLRWMRAEGLPVPRPVAAQVTPSGMFYRAAIITERIPEARPMEEVLRDNPLPADLWGRVGAVIRQMHDAGVYHSDLNCRNILIDAEQKIWLIDFDKCRRRAPGSWQAENLERLRRSLRKESGKGVGLHWTEGNWSALIAGYKGAESDGAVARP